jgi:hypothetical protein
MNQKENVGNYRILRWAHLCVTDNFRHNLYNAVFYNFNFFIHRRYQVGACYYDVR